METRFHIGDVLTVITGKMVALSTDGLYGILNYMTGQDLFTHQLPRAAEVCAQSILAQHPELAGVDASGVNPDNWKEWLHEQADKFGEFIAIYPRVQYTPLDPITELLDMMER